MAPKQNEDGGEQVGAGRGAEVRRAEARKTVPCRKWAGVKDCAGSPAVRGSSAAPTGEVPKTFHTEIDSP